MGVNAQLWGHTGMYPELQVSKAAATAISSRVQVCLDCVVEASEICLHEGTLSLRHAVKYSHGSSLTGGN